MTNSESSPKYQLSWETGTAYDFFISLDVLHNPAQFGLRGAWAAGVRSRVSSEVRDVLEKITEVIYIPFEWLHTLPDPKDITTMLYALKTIPEEERVASLLFQPEETELKKFYNRIAGQGFWEEEDMDIMEEIYQERGHEYPRKKMQHQLNTWAKSGKLCQEILPALQDYYDAFFAEEEQRIIPKITAAVETCRKRADEITVPELLEEFTRGLTLTDVLQREKIILVPSFWIYPLINYRFMDDDTVMLMYGIRSSEESLVPGELVPDELLLSLKALADPTRLRILRYLVDESLTSAELARRLRLRAPTLTHHLHSLRLAGLVRISSKGKLERKYSVRAEAVNSTFASLKSFLATTQIDDDLLADFDQNQIW